ncbi:MAG: hypothetical protein KF773_15875 [Deltaproteobacteria bacterium]|nr:hypothetical protein [Deltaproteobacteria bacterium]
MDPIRSSWWVSSLALAGLVGLAGCSLTLSGPDAKRPRHKVPACDRSKGIVAVDGVAGGLFGLTGLALLADGEEASAIPLIVGGIYVLAAVYGNSTVDECNAAVAKFENDETRRRELARTFEAEERDEAQARPGRASRAALKKQLDAPTGAPRTPAGNPQAQDTARPPQAQDTPRPAQDTPRSPQAQDTPRLPQDTTRPPQAQDTPRSPTSPTSPRTPRAPGTPPTPPPTTPTTPPDDPWRDFWKEVP